MDITPLVPSNFNIIQSYDIKNKFFRINDVKYETNIILSAEEIIPIKINSPDDILTLKELKSLTNKLDLLFIGHSSTHPALSADFRKYMAQNNIKYEAMNLGAACRTYNILLTEGRNIGAILIF